jgi:glycosyltransferase involved in cell wall biosynthesis
MGIVSADVGRVSARIGTVRRRVLIIVQNMPVPLDIRVWQEATELSAAGYTVSVICPAGRGYDAHYEVLDNIAIYRYPQLIDATGVFGYLLEYLISLFWQFILAWRVFFDRGFDVIQACNPPDDIFLIALFFKVLFGRKFIFDHHDLCPELFEVIFRRRGLIYRMLLLFERLTFMIADVSIATNESYRLIAIQRGRMHPEKVFVVRNGPRLDMMRVIASAPELKKDRRYLVGYAGVMGHQDGIQYLLEVARCIIYDKCRNDIEFILIGDGPARPKMEQMAHANGIAEYVKFTGRVSHEKVLALLSTTDVCVDPDEVNTLNDKSTMIKIMEYMALGKPIVQFDVTEGRISAGPASLYASANDPVAMAEKILELVDDQELRHKMGQFGRERIKSELAWCHQVPKLLAAYEEVFRGVDVRYGERTSRGQDQNSLTRIKGETRAGLSPAARGAVRSESVSRIH